MISIEIAKYFQPLTIIIVLLLSIKAKINWNPKNYKLLSQNGSNIPLIILVLAVYCIIIGYRPISAKYFGDTVNYARSFENLQNGIIPFKDEDRDWLFDMITVFFSSISNVWVYFTAIMLGYIFFAFAGIYRLFKNNSYGALLFFVGAFSFFAYATNGIRNGLACSIFIFGFSYIVDKKIWKRIILGVGICYVATLIHNSVMLPFICLIVAYFVRNIRIAVVFWVFSIFLYLVANVQIENFFSTLGFDERLTSYIQESEEYAETFKGGFRLDFLLYSFMPILLALIVINKKDINIDWKYKLLINTYIFANSFWIMVMNAAYSNRFAYLSWFLYPIVLAYPCLKMNIWNNFQGKKAGNILLFQVGFTAFMDLIIYGRI